MADSETAPTTQNGVLTKFIAQTQTNAPSISENGTMSWSETYKGPYELGKDILWQCVPNASRRSNIIGPNQDSFISLFSPPRMVDEHGHSSRDWVFKSGRCDQIDSGWHCNLTFEWSSVADLSSLQDTPNYTVWQFRSGCDQIDVFAYCTNTDISSFVDAGNNGESYSSRIQTWWDQPSDTSILKPSYQFQSVVGAGSIGKLNQAEIAIAKKLQSGRRPQRHYPIIVRTDYYQGNPTINFEKIDHIIESNDALFTSIASDGSGECPYTLEGWQWLLTDINSSFNTNTKMTTVSYQMTGAKEWDENFYGSDPFSDADCSGRWEIGGVKTKV